MYRLKVDIEITVHFRGEDPEFKELSITEMDYSLTEIINALVPRGKKISYNAKMENFNTGVIVEKSQ